VISMKIRRVILFAADVPATAAFYAKAFGLTVRGDAADREFVDMDAGGCRLAVHRGAPAKSRGAPRIVFGCDDVAAARELLAKLGAKMGKLVEFEDLRFCDGADPSGNVFQISNRP